MLFAEDATVQGVAPWVTFLLGGGAVGVITAIGKLVGDWLNRRDTQKARDKADDQKDEDNAVNRLREVMEMRERDCSNRISDLTVKMGAMDARITELAKLKDALQERLAISNARRMYLEAMLKQNNIKVDAWDLSDAALPQVSTSPKETQS